MGKLYPCLTNEPDDKRLSQRFPEKHVGKILPKFLIDGGSETHVTNNHALFFQKFSRVRLTKGVSGKCQMSRVSGHILVKLQNKMILLLKNVVCLPSCPKNLLSLSLIENDLREGFKEITENGRKLFGDKNKQISATRQGDGLY